MDQSDFTLLTLVQSCSLETSPEGDSGICCFSSSVFPGLSLLPTHRPARFEHWSASVVNLTVTSHFLLSHLAKEQLMMVVNEHLVMSYKGDVRTSETRGTCRKGLNLKATASPPG